MAKILLKNQRSILTEKPVSSVAHVVIEDGHTILKQEFIVTDDSSLARELIKRKNDIVGIADGNGHMNHLYPDAWIHVIGPERR